MDLENIDISFFIRIPITDTEDRTYIEYIHKFNTIKNIRVVTKFFDPEVVIASGMINLMVDVIEFANLYECEECSLLQDRKMEEKRLNLISLYAATPNQIKVIFHLYNGIKSVNKKRLK